MQIGVIGLGRMGGNITRRLMKAGRHCVVIDGNAETREALAKEGATSAGSLAEVVKALGEKPRGLGDAAHRPDHRRDAQGEVYRYQQRLRSSDAHPWRFIRGRRPRRREIPPSARLLADTVNVGPGRRYDVIWTARQPGK